MFRREAKGLFHSAAIMQADVTQLRTQLSALQSRLDHRLEEANQDFETRLFANVDPGVRDEVYQRVVKRLEKIDVLRYPRRLLSMPVRGVKALISRWWPSDAEDQEAPEELRDPVASETFHMLESELIRFANESRLDIIGQPGLENILDRQQQRHLRLGHDELKAMFAEHQQRFQQWVSEHAMQTAAEITSGNKAKFIISQVLFNTVLITAQVHTGGALSLFELGVDSVISPFVAKAIGAAIGNEKVLEFEKQAQKVHQESLAQVLIVGRDRYRDFLNEAGKELDALDEQLTEIVNHTNAEQDLVTLFESERAGGTAE